MKACNSLRNFTCDISVKIKILISGFEVTQIRARIEGGED
jgi:hypothetical protein